MTEQDISTWTPPRPPRPRHAGRIVFWILVGLAAALLVISLAIPLATTRRFSVPSTSMENTVRPGDQVAVAVGSAIRRGDVVVLHVPGTPSGSKGLYIKRVIGLPGDHVACCDASGRVTVNGKPLNETYVYPGDPASQRRFSVTLGRGQIWVMGDQRTVSLDSREWGPVPASGVTGPVIVVIHGFSVTWLHTPPTFVTDGLAPVDRRSSLAHVALTYTAVIAVLALLALAIVGLARAVIRRRRGAAAPVG